MPITIKNSAGGGVTLDSTTTANETVNLPTGGGNLITTTGATFTGNVLHSDNVKSTFGAGNDLEIFHDGTHSRIKDVGTGHLVLSGGEVHFNNSDNTSNHLVINSAGIVTKPLQPAFSAYRTLGNVTSGVYICNLTHFNTGGHYSTSTGRFTAPVAGRYTISSILMSQTDNTYNNKAYTIRVNDSNYKEVYGSSGSAVHHQFVWSGIIELAANDYVTLNYQNFTMYGGGSTYSTFSGHLIG